MQSVESVPKKKREGYSGDDLWKRTVFSLEFKSVMDGETGELIEEVLIGTGGM